MRASVDGRLVPIPIDLDTINELYGTYFDAFQVGEFYQSVAEPRAEPKTSEDVILSQVGRELYENFFRKLHPTAVGARSLGAGCVGHRASADPNQPG